MIVIGSTQNLVAEVVFLSGSETVVLPVDTAWRTRQGIAWVDQGYVGSPTRQAHLALGDLTSSNPWVIKSQDTIVTLRDAEERTDWKTLGSDRAQDYLLGWHPELRQEIS